MTNIVILRHNKRLRNTQSPFDTFSFDRSRSACRTFCKHIFVQETTLVVSFIKGSDLKALREKHSISQEKLCALLQHHGCDIGRSTYAKYENGELNIKVSVLIELHKIYGCTYDDFFAGLDI